MVRWLALALLTVGAVQDWRTRRLAPWVVWPFLGLAVAYRLWWGGVTPWLWALGWLAVGYALRMGGADAKLLAGLALFAPSWALWAFLGVGVWYLALWVWWWERPQRFPAVPGMAIGLTIALLWV